ncbi:GtrA family protein [Rhizobium sp. NRK18]|uniref:GtrA family protein n=1 Tax=Rhizobium sp. NRK18 TaxID=2964667 RepID=UPI0021C423CE|nr:GtrA family protein [Rhizobium sp. NRK18]MCQ2005163.1 GtrA family protein [Rhizobium sp. NRK18]
MIRFVTERASTVLGRDIVTFLKYGMTGVANTLVDVATFSVLLWLGADGNLANVAGFGMGAVNSYMMNKHYTFAVAKGAGAGAEVKRIAAFSCVVLLCLLVSAVAFHLAYSTFGAVMAKVISTLAVLVFGFTLNRAFVFRNVP